MTTSPALAALLTDLLRRRLRRGEPLSSSQLFVIGPAFVVVRMVS